MREKLISDHGWFSSYRRQQGAFNGQYPRAFFKDAQGFERLDAGSRAGFIQLKKCTTRDLGFSIYTISV